jgi:hypothetical protein
MHAILISEQLWYLPGFPKCCSVDEDGCRALHTCHVEKRKSCSVNLHSLRRRSGRPAASQRSVSPAPPFLPRGGNCHFKMKIILFFERDKTTYSEQKSQFYNRRPCQSRCKLSKTHVIFDNDPPAYIIIQAYTKIKRLKTLQDLIVFDWSPNFFVLKIVKYL